MNFQQATALIKSPLAEVEAHIGTQAQEFDADVAQYITYVCANGGKRLRPIIALLAGGVAGGLNEKHTSLAVIVELVHIATLVHDDIIDEADLRRGNPTANAKWGNAMSVLVGDALFAQALRLAAGLDVGDACRRIADATSEVCTGEIRQGQHRFDTTLSISDYLDIIEKKTASLFAIAAEMGGVLAQAPDETVHALHTYGTHLGTAFQIYDDILDFSQDESSAGKTLGTDLCKGKFTLPILLLLANNADAAKLLTQNVQFEAVRTAIVQAQRPLAESRTLAKNLLLQASASLAVLPPSPYRDALDALTLWLSDRLDAVCISVV